MITIPIAQKENGYEWYEKRIYLTRVRKLECPETGGFRILGDSYYATIGTSKTEEEVPNFIGDLMFANMEVQKPEIGMHKQIRKWTSGLGTTKYEYTEVAFYPVD